MYLQRTLAKSLETATKSFKVVLITGPRQVGKTTLFKHIKEEGRNYISLDDVEACALAQTDPAMFLEKYKAPILIDEVQKAPNLFPYIKMIVDNTETKGLFWLTGSQQFQLMKNVSESLAGRVAILNLQGFSQAEKVKDYNRPAFFPDLDLKLTRPILSVLETFEMITRGAYPQLYDNLTEWHLFYSSYIATYIERDVREITQVTNENSFIKFLKVAASRTGQVLNYNDIAKDVGVSPNTIKSWISILETSGLIYLLPPYFNNLGKRITKTPKMYFLDTGLCCYLCGIVNGEMLMQHSMSGALFETYAVSEILKSYWHNGQRPFIYFYRDTEQKEIDLLLERDGKVFPIEIKQTSSPNLSMAKNFSIIEDKKRGIGVIICLADKFIPINREVYIIPVGYI